MKTAIELIAKERQEQIEKHNRPVERDIKENPSGQLRQGAIAILDDREGSYLFPKEWNFEICDKMRSKPYKERLIIAATLLAAEYDRIQAAGNQS